MSMTFDTLNGVAVGVTNSWIFSAAGCGFSSYVPRLKTLRPVLSRIKGELQPFYWPAGAVTITHEFMTQEKLFARLLTVLSLVFMWYAYKDTGDDNDKWKKRGRKVLQKITAIGGRLVVNPA